jgi:hypothetical protein
MLVTCLVPALVVSAPKPGDDGTPEYRVATDLVQDLGNSRFNVREAAAKKLLDMGAAAIPALAAGSKSADEEVRNRSTALLGQARANEWKRRADAFLADQTGKQTHDLPLLAEWEKLNGKLDAGSRKLFAGIVRADGQLLDLASRDHTAGVKALTVASSELLDPVRSKGKQLDAPAERIAALLFAEAVLKREKDAIADNSRNRPLYLLANPSVAKALDDKEFGPAYRRLVVAWAESRPRDEFMSGLFFALLTHRHPFAEANAHLIRLATERKNEQLRWVAMEALGRSDRKEALAKLTELLSDKSALYEDLGGKDAGHHVGDCALAALVHGRAKTEEDYGLTRYMTANFWAGGEADTVTLHLCGFESAAARERGVKKWLTEAAAKK